LSSVYRNTVLTLAGLAAPALLIGLVFGGAWGWGALTAGLLAFLAWHVRHLARLARWLANPLAGNVPEGEGIWDDVLASLHRLERDAAKREEGLADALARMRRAVQALPDGVVILDSANRIEWCNRTAEAQLQLDGRADLGQNIANLVREPEFVEYLQSFDQEAAVRIARGQGVALSRITTPSGSACTARRMCASASASPCSRFAASRSSRCSIARTSSQMPSPSGTLPGRGLASQRSSCARWRTCQARMTSSAAAIRPQPQAAPKISPITSAGAARPPSARIVFR
jgi:PAS domain-containing protein